MAGSVDVEAAKDGAEAPNGLPSQRTTGYAVETSGKLWSVYLAESERHDKALAESWKADMDGLLIFAGLFSAVVTAFLVGSLQQMTQSNQTPPSPTPSGTPANTPSLLRANALWCSSLLSSLLSALCATLVQQWARQYTQALGRRTAAHQRARVRAFLLQGIERSGVKVVVEGAPALLHLAMFLFIAGLIDITAPASRMLSLLSLIVLIAIAAFYLALSWFPLHDMQSPYRTPLSSALWYIKQAVRPLNFTNVEGSTVVVDSGSLSRGREEYATATIDGTQERDLASLSWTLSSLIDRGDCEPFIEGIAGFMHSDRIVGAPLIMLELVKRKDLARHILELLVNCVEPAHDSIDIRRRQSISGLGALRALTANWFSDDAGVTVQDGDPHGVWKWSYSFPEKVIDITMSLRSASDSVISMHARCTAAVAVWRLLVDYDELGAYTKQKLVTVERLLAYLESTRDKARRSGRRVGVRDKIKEKISHDLLAVWAQSTQTHIETLRMNSPQQDSQRAQFQNWDAEKADLKMMRYLWEQNVCPPEAWLYDDVELQHNETDNGESSMLDSVLAYLSSHAKLLHRTLKPLESTHVPVNAYVDEATECLDQWSSATMKQLMPRIIASGHVANVIQLIKHATKGPRRSDADQILILETLETITVPIRALQGKLNERSQRSLLGLLKFLKEQHLDVMFRDIDNLSGSIYQFIVKIGEKIIPLAVRGLGTPNLWQSAQSILLEYEDTCPDLAETLSDAQTWIRGNLLHYHFSAAQPSRKPLLLPAPAPSASQSPPTVTTDHSRLPLSKPAGPLSPDSEKSSKPKALEVEIYRLVPTDGRRNAHKIMRPLYSPSGRLQELYIDAPVEPEEGNFIDTMQPAGLNRRNGRGVWTATRRFYERSPAPAVRPPSPPSSSKRGSVTSLLAQKSHDGALAAPTQPPSPSSSNRRGREGWWTARGSHDDLPTSHARPPLSPSSPSGRSRAESRAPWLPYGSAPASPTQPPSPTSLSWPIGSEYWPAFPPSPPLPSPSSSSASSNSASENGFVLAARLEPFAPPMQASASLQTAITAETDSAQDGNSLPVVVVQRREDSGSGSWSRMHSSRGPSPKSLAPATPPPPRGLFGHRTPPYTTPPPPPHSLFGLPSATTLPERSRSSAPTNSRRPSPPLPAIAGDGLGLYIPQQSYSGPRSLSAPGKRRAGKLRRYRPDRKARLEESNLLRRA
ncbi:hypothetical protein EI94DRAFT_741613 [Lactarius quietus]|nr:hypothetical protein EI94DRAFT_741613 [Lactarius quietus]